MFGTCGWVVAGQAVHVQRREAWRMTGCLGLRLAGRSAISGREGLRLAPQHIELSNPVTHRPVQPRLRPCGGAPGCVWRECGIDRRGCSTLAQSRQSQSIVHRGAHRLVHFAAVAEPHLNFGRVHVHIHTGRVDGDEQHVNSLALPV